MTHLTRGDADRRAADKDKLREQLASTPAPPDREALARFMAESGAQWADYLWGDDPDHIRIDGEVSLLYLADLILTKWRLVPR